MRRDRRCLRNQGRRGGPDDCRGRGIHEPRAFRHAKAETAFSRNAEIYDTTIGWRFVNPLMKAQYGIDSMPETGENVASEFGISRADQDAFAVRSQEKAVAAQQSGRLSKEIAPVSIPQRKGEPIVVTKDEHPRAGTTVEMLDMPISAPQDVAIMKGAMNYDACMQLVAYFLNNKDAGLKYFSEQIGFGPTHRPIYDELPDRAKQKIWLLR